MKKNNAVYTPPTVTADAVIFRLNEGNLEVLLINRAKQPFKNCWALPGSYMANGETSIEAFDRTVRVKAGVDSAQLGHVEQLYTFDTVARDPRGHAISITHLGLGYDVVVSSSNKTEKPVFVPVAKLSKLAFDHDAIVDYGLKRLQSKLSYTNIMFALLPKVFTLTDLQKSYEIVMGRQLDKRNFRKKMLSYNMIKETGKNTIGAAHRPAKLYQFKQSQLEALVRSLD
jgi:8-oxo-dGTP diphosphatase